MSEACTWGEKGRQRRLRFRLISPQLLGRELSARGRYGLNDALHETAAVGTAVDVHGEDEVGDLCAAFLSEVLDSLMH